MSVIAFQGLRGGTGTTSLVAAVAWALKTLGERVIALDFSATNHLGLHFNTPHTQPRGWMRCALDRQPWQESALRYDPGLDFIPFGSLAAEEQQTLGRALAHELPAWPEKLEQLARDYDWVLLDLPSDERGELSALRQLAQRQIVVVNADANCHVRLHQQRFDENALFLLNNFNANSKVQQDVHQLWLSTLQHFIPLMIHRDEALAEAMMIKQPLGEYRPHSLAAEEVNTLANWLLVTLRRPV